MITGGQERRRFFQESGSEEREGGRLAPSVVSGEATAQASVASEARTWAGEGAGMGARWPAPGRGPGPRPPAA